MAPVTYWRNPTLDMRVAPPPPAGYATAAHARPSLPTPSPVGLNYHTYVPAKGGWALPKGAGLGFTPGKGYYARPGAAGAAGPAAPTDPWTALLSQIMGKGSAVWETPAQQEARANREADAQIAAQKKLYDDEYQRQIRNAQANAMGMAAAGAAAAAMSKDLFGSVGGEYNAAAGEIKGLAHGLSKNAEGAANADVGSANAFLSATGNAAVAQGGPFGMGGDLQQGVEEYRGGTLAGQMFGTQGEAANFGLAGMISSQNLQATEEAKASLMKATQDANDAQNKAIASLAAGRTDLFHTFMNDAQDAKIKMISLAQGLQASMTAAASIKPITRIVNGSLQQYDMNTGKWKLAVKGTNPAVARATAAAAKAKLPNATLSKVYGHVVDSAGNAILKDGQIQPVAKSSDGVKANVQLSRALGKWVDANGIAIPSLNKPGSPKPPPFFKPKTGSSKAKVTDAQLATGSGYIHEHQLLLSAIQKVKAFNAAQIAAGAKRGGRPWAENPVTIEEVSQMEPKFLASMKITAAESRAAEDPHTLQEVYIDMVHEGIPARRAWAMMRKYYPNFGQGYFT